MEAEMAEDPQAADDVRPVGPGFAVPSRREVIAAAAAAMAAMASGDRAAAQAGAEGYFFVFQTFDRVFFIPSAWLELFEVTEAYEAKHPNNWKKALKKIRDDTGSKQMKALYATSNRPDFEKPVPGTVIPADPPDPGSTYLAMMISP